MKSIKNILAALVTLAAVLAVTTPEAKAQSNLQYQFGTFLSDSTSIGTSTTSTITNTPLKIVGVQGVAVTVTFTSGSTSETNLVTAQFATSLDGTNYSTYASDLVFSVPLNGTNVVRAYKQFGSQVLNNARYFKLLSIKNTSGSNAITVSAVNYGVRF